MYLIKIWYFIYFVYDVLFFYEIKLVIWKRNIIIKEKKIFNIIGKFLVIWFLMWKISVFLWIYGKIYNNN